MYFTVQKSFFENIMGAGLGRGLGTDGRRRAPLNFIIKKKQPRKTPCGADPGSDLAEEVAPLNFSFIVLPVR